MPSARTAPARALLLALLAVAFSLVVPHSALGAPSCPQATYAAPPPGGKCKQYSSSLPDGSLAFCNGIVDYPYFEPTGLNQTALDQAAQAKLLGNNPQQNGLLLSLLPESCTVQLKRIVCLAAFQACELVDPYFADTSCGATAVCTTCGDIATVSDPATQLFLPNPNPQTPVYSSACFDGVALTTKACVVGVGKVPGLGHIGWETAKAAQTPTATMEVFCGTFGLTWSAQDKSCLVAVPRSACKSECDKVWSMDRTPGLVNGLPAFVNAVCPLVSGNWNTLLTALSGSADTYVAAQATAALGSATAGRTTVPLLAAFSLAPNCSATLDAPLNSVYAFAETYTTELTGPAPPRAGSVGLVMKTKADALATTCHCVNNLAVLQGTPTLLAEATNTYCNPSKTAAYCGEIANVTSRCFKSGGSLRPNPGMQFVGAPGQDEGMHPICKQVVTHPNNQPNEQTLALLQAAYGIPAEIAKGAFFVPPAPGLPALAAGSMTARNLCAIPNGLGNGEVFRGNNSYQCAVASVRAAANVIPPVLAGSCRLKFLDMLCNQAHMKLEFKQLCLLPNDAPCNPNIAQAAATNTLGFTFALPRFASRQMCTDFKTECNGFLNSLGPARAELEATFNCTGNIEQTCAKNNPLDEWTSSAWGCSSSLNGRPAYPETSQNLADLSGLLGPYAVANNLSLLALGGLTVSAAASPSVSSASNGLGNAATCECPSPLVVPDNPSHTANPATCCQLQCVGYAFSDEQFDSIITAQRIISVLSLIGTLFIILTWSCFKIKRTQFLTFFIGFSSFMVSFTFIIPTYYKMNFREVLCKDNTQPNRQSDGGMCLFQSIWLSYWTLVICLFWLCQSFDLFMRVVRGERHLERFTKFYHLLAWGYPLALVIVYLATDAYGYQSGQFWCFLRDMPENPELARGLDLGLFYGSIIAIWSLGLIFMFMVLYQIFKITSKTVETAQSSNKIAKRLALYRTPVFFVFFFSYVWVSIFGWRFDFEVKLPLIEEAGTAWAQCLLTNFGKGISDPATNPLANSTTLEKYGVPPNTGCGVLFPVRVQYSTVMYLMFITGLQGVFIFVIFGAKVENLNLWKEKLKLTTKKYDTTAEDSSTKENKSAKPSMLSQAMSSIFATSSPKLHESNGEKEGGSAVMVNGLQSGKFIAVTDVGGGSSSPPIKSNQVAAAYMSDE